MEVHNNNNNVPVTIEDEIEVIDLDDYLNVSKDVVIKWDKKIRSGILELVGCNEQQLEKFLEQYKKSLKEEATLFTDRHLVKEKFRSHMISIYFCCSHILFKSSHWTPYVEQYENLLAEYCTLELSGVQHLTRKHDEKNSECEFFTKQCTLVYQRLCSVLGVCLQDSEKHIMHVLLKLRYNTQSPACRNIMNGIFSNFMINLPQKDYSDEAFCRYFLALKRWQQIREISAHVPMENVMYTRMHRSNNCIKNDETIQTILGIRCLDSVAIFSLITDSIDVSKTAYFNYIRQNKSGVGAYESDCSLKISSDEDSSVVVLSDDEQGCDDDVEIVQISGPDPINVVDDDDVDDGPLKSFFETPKSRPEPQKSHIEEVVKEQTALVVEENEEEVLHYQLEESESVQTKDVPMEEVVENEKEQNVPCTSDIEDEDAILDRFKDITTEENAIETDEEMHLIEEEKSTVEENRKVAPVEVEMQIDKAVGENSKITPKEVEMKCSIEISEEKSKQFATILSGKVENASRRHSMEIAVVPPEEKEIRTEKVEVAVIEENREIPPAVEEIHHHEEEGYREVSTKEVEVYSSDIANVEENRQLPPVEEELHYQEVREVEVYSNEVTDTEENRVLPPEAEEMHFHEVREVEIYSNEVAYIDENREDAEMQFNEDVETAVQEYREIPTEEGEVHFSEAAVIADNRKILPGEVVSANQIRFQQVTNDIESNFQGKEIYFDTSATENCYYEPIQEETVGAQKLFNEHYCDVSNGERCECVTGLQETETEPVELRVGDVCLVGENGELYTICGPQAEEIAISEPPSISLQEQQKIQMVESVVPEKSSEATISSIQEQLLLQQQQILMENIVPEILEPPVLNIQPPPQQIMLANVVPEKSEPPVLSIQQQSLLLRQPKKILPEPPILSIQPHETLVPLEQPPSTYKQRQRTRRNGTKSKSAIERPTTRTATRNGLTAHSSYKEPQIPIPPQQLQPMEKELLNGGVDYQDNNRTGNNGRLLNRRNNNNKTLKDMQPKRKTITIAEEEKTIYEYDSGYEQHYRRPRRPPRTPAKLQSCIKITSPPPVSNDVYYTQCRNDISDVQVNLEVTVKAKMEKFIDDRKRKRTEEAANRLKTGIPRPLQLHRVKPPSIGDQQPPQPRQLLRYDYDKSTPPAPSPPAPSQQEHHRLATSTTPGVLRPASTVRGRRKGNRSVGVNRTSIASRGRTKVNGSGSVTMDMLFDSLKNATDSSLKFKKGDKT